MRRDWDDAPHHPRSDGRQPPQRTPNDTAGMPLPQRRHVAPEAQPSTFAAYEPPTPPAPARAARQRPDERATDRVLRRVDGTPIRDTRAKPARRHAAQRPTTPTPGPTPTLDYKSVDFVMDATVVESAFDIDFKSPATRAESQRHPTYERPAPPTARPPAVTPQPALPPLSGSNRAMLPQRQSLTPPPATNRSIVSRPLPKVISQPQQAIAPYVETAPPSAEVCPHCRGLGFLRLDVPIGHHSFGKAIPCACKETEYEERRRDEHRRLSNLDIMKDMTFDYFDRRALGTQESFDAAESYAENMKGWLMLGGPCGSGKTHLAAAIANEIFEKGTLVLFTFVPQLLDHLRATFAPNSSITYDALFDKVCQAGLLVLDDLGSEHSTAWAQEKLFQIINHRYMERLPTVITTNLRSLDDIDERVRSRLRDKSLVRYVRLDGVKDYRPQNVPRKSSHFYRP